MKLTTKMKKETKKGIVILAALPLFAIGAIGGSMIFGVGGIFPPAENEEGLGYFIHMIVGMATTLVCCLGLPALLSRIMLGKDEDPFR